MASRSLIRAFARRHSSAVQTPLTRVTTLPSGFRVASENTGIPTATVGVWVDAGSRYEHAENNGVAHFLEHMAFKGTKRRTQTELELEVENMGAHLNAYTSREQTVYYAKCFSKDLEHAVDILADILGNSVLGAREIERERGVILREMQEVEQNHQEVVFDLLHSGAFKQTPLAMTILGPKENIERINRNQILSYIQTHYRGPRVVLAGAGGVPHEQLVELAHKYFAFMDATPSEAAIHDAQFTPCELSVEDTRMPFVYGAMCVEGASWTHPDNLPLMVANTLIGEWDRTRGSGVSIASRLAARLGHEARVQSFQAFNTCYKETGLMGVYFVSEPQGGLTLVDAIAEEWRWLATSVEEADVERGKRSLLTNLLLMLDGSTPICKGGSIR